MENPEATKILIEYKAKLQQEVLDLRELACQKALIVRTIEKTISDSDVNELNNYLQVQEAYSLKGIDNLVFNK